MSEHTMNQPVVLDLGSGLTKGGFAASAEPQVVIGSVVGIPKLRRVMPTATGNAEPPSTEVLGVDAASMHDTGRSKYAAKAASANVTQHHTVVVGEELKGLAGVVRLVYPLERGVVTEWDLAERLWRHVMNDVLKAEYAAHPALITENPLNPKQNRERLAHFFFESMRVPALYISIPAVLSLYASGRTTGVVLDVGDTVSTALPIAEGHCATHAINRIDLAGRDVTDRMSTLMRRSGTTLEATSSEKQVVRRVKERFAYVATDPREEEQRVASHSAPNSTRAVPFELPDGNTIFVGPERFRAPEVLFSPSLIAAELPGVQDCVRNAIDSVDIELRKRMHGSILLAVCFNTLAKLYGRARCMLE